MLPTVKRSNEIGEQSEEELVESEGGGWEVAREVQDAQLKVNFRQIRKNFLVCLSQYFLLVLLLFWQPYIRD